MKASRTLVLGRLVLAALFAGLLLAAVAGPVEIQSVEQTTYLLQAASLARDFDLVFDEADVERLRAAGWSEDARVGLGFGGDEIHRFERPLPYVLLAAPFARLAPTRGPLVLNVLLLALAAWIATGFLDRVSGDTAPWLVAAFVFGSAIFGYALRVLPESLLIAATAAAFGLAWKKAPLGRELPDMHPGRGPASASLLRWVAIGGLLGILGVHHPVFLLLGLPLVLGASREGRAAGLPALVVGLVLVLLVCWFAGGLYADFLAPEKLARAGDSVADLGVRGASPVTGAEKRPLWPPAVEPALYGWNLFYAIAGRHVGLLIYLLPLLLAAALAWGSEAGRWLALSAGVAFVALLVFFPFNFWGGPAVGNRWMIPFFAAAWFAAARPVRVVTAVAFLAAGSVLMAPLWLRAEPSSSGPFAGLFQRLPFETTQRAVPVHAEIVRQGSRVRVISGVASSGDPGEPLVLGAGETAHLIVATDAADAAGSRGASAPRVTFAFGAAAAGDPEISGGALDQTMFRPDGGVTYRIRPDGRGIRHSTWWTEDVQHFLNLRFSMPETPVPLGFSISVESAGD